MHFSTLSGSIALLLAGAQVVSAHGVFVDAYGDADPSIRGYGLGYGHDTTRKGTWLFPHQKDVPVFSNKIVHNKWWNYYNPDGCGICVDSVAGWYQKNKPHMWDPKITGEKERWKFLWEVSPSPDAYISDEKGIAYLNWLEKTGKTRINRVNDETLKSGIPKVTAGGSLNVMNYQINLDGAGPFKCKISYHGAAHSWKKDLSVTKNCPGDAKSLFWPGIQKPCWFTIQMPNDLDCTGANGIENICLVRCENNADNGPFGGCIPVQQIRPVKKTQKEGGKTHYGKGYHPNPKKEDAKKPAPRPKPANKKPTKEEVKAAMGGENYDNGVAEELQHEYISDEDKNNLSWSYKHKDPINNYYYKRELKARRRAIAADAK
ncbi:hypothetical protein TWF718_001522 [Orbilia javanica]|uniref:Uncharacterized protein n=1 Tax=Orbilia javanica TaxID=47235 RepID=A0AAN8N1F5_9PEZI